jgi:hypothetical protein
MAYQAYEDDAPKPRNDAYTGILAISFFAMLIACMLMLVDWYRYQNVKGPEKISKLLPPIGAAPAKGAPAKPPADIGKDKPKVEEKLPKGEGKDKAKMDDKDKAKMEDKDKAKMEKDKAKDDAKDKAKADAK